MAVCTCTYLPRLAPHCICHADDNAVHALNAVRRAFTRHDQDPLTCERNAHIWLHTFNPRLDGVPADLILAGAGSRVAEEARRHCA